MAEWTTPDAVHSKCGEEVFEEAILAIDDNIGTYWRHNAGCYHWIIFDMGETKTITKIRIYQETGYNFWGGTIGLYVYVGDDPADLGGAVWDGVLDVEHSWVESGAFEKDGRYVKLVSKDSSFSQRMREFDAYVEAIKRGLFKGLFAGVFG